MRKRLLLVHEEMYPWVHSNSILGSIYNFYSESREKVTINMRVRKIRIDRKRW